MAMETGDVEGLSNVGGTSGRGLVRYIRPGETSGGLKGQAIAGSTPGNVACR